MASPPIACPVCAALLLRDATTTHVDWHAATRTLNGWSPGQLAVQIRDNYEAVSALAGDDAPTQKFPRLSETVLRRPPAPEVRELKGRELLLALAEELRGYDDEAEE